MKKFLTIIGLAFISSAYGQGGPLVINNYTSYDFHTRVTAANLTTPGCYFYVALNDPELVISGGNSVSYNSYNIPGTTWKVSTSPTNATPRPGNHPSLTLGGVISNNTKWVMSEFQFYQTGTPLSSGAVGDTAYTCNPVPNIFNTPQAVVEWFTITSGTTTSTYIQIY
ncbi:hypothetical protein SAMN05421866_1287 [Chryseobacterium oranimense]|uniref:Uncharacterized protein n=1 Tax=Chryseobacterium oranimense TaxID=421058 RepID=A0A1M5M0V8_9FLAO|nr:hypothetical protein [Chryseobacterium oranimense]SHG70876.1 hypothetical protein SAMN05421866_1287 [Chryseobacterium oranimense]